MANVKGQTIGVYLNNTLATEFERYCKEHGLSKSETIRGLIESLLVNYE